ncbi:MAG: hypothetical protein HY275_08945 [Gemmatimonadetes bacterium]|nr:hypothetical protein [Gemmatimonadota bacterium]
MRIRIRRCPTLQNIVMSMEESPGNQWAGLIYVENRSSVPINVTSVTLRNCENIKQQCGTLPIRRTVEPDSKTMVLRVEEKMPAQGHGFSYTVAWSADSASVRALKVLADAGSADAADRIAAAKHGEEVRKLEVGARDHELYGEELAKMGDQIAVLRAVPDTMRIPAGSMIYVNNVRVLAYDAMGNLLGRFRGRYRFRVQPGAVRFGPPDSLVAVVPGQVQMDVMPEPVPGMKRTLQTVSVTLVVPGAALAAAPSATPDTTAPAKPAKPAAKSATKTPPKSSKAPAPKPTSAGPAPTPNG